MQRADGQTFTEEERDTILYGLYKKQGGEALAKFIANRDLVHFRRLLPRDSNDSQALEHYCEIFENTDALGYILSPRLYPQIATSEQLRTYVELINPQSDNFDMSKALGLLYPIVRNNYEHQKNFTREYLTEHKGKMDSKFIKDYLGTGATIEIFIYRSLSSRLYGEFPEEKIEGRIKDILGDDNYKRVIALNNAYNKGIEGENVSDCDFSALSQEQFEMLRFDEDTIFNQETIDKFHPEEILTRRNTLIQNQTDNGDMLHIAIIDTPIAESGNNQNLIVHNLENTGEPKTDTHHGRSAYSIFSSVNPNCVVHFYGVGPEDDDRAEAVQAINEYNNRCTDESQKIKLISCSHNLGENERKLITDGKLNVISADNLHSGDFFEYFRFDDKDVVPELTDEEGDAIEDRYKFPITKEIAKKFVSRFKSFGDAILVNVNLSIDQHFKEIKRHECDLSVSWGVPVIAAYYAMALKANPDMGYKDFRDICKSSLKDGIFDEMKFIENIRALEQKIGQDTSHQETLEDKKRNPLEDYKRALEESTDTSYRRGSIDEYTGEVRADLVRREEKERNNDDPNIE